MCKCAWACGTCMCMHRLACISKRGVRELAPCDFIPIVWWNGMLFTLKVLMRTYGHSHVHSHSFISLLVLVSHYFCLYRQYELVSFYLPTYHCVSAIDSENVSRSKLLFGIEWDSPCMALFHWECICHRQCLCLPCHCTIENVSVIENVFLYIPVAS